MRAFSELQPIQRWLDFSVRFFAKNKAAIPPNKSKLLTLVLVLIPLVFHPSKRPLGHIIRTYYGSSLRNLAVFRKMSSFVTRPSLVAVVDDDESVREALESLLKSRGYHVDTYSAAEDFQKSPSRRSTDCLILDVRLNGMSGPALQQELITARDSLPIVFITAHADEQLRTQVIEAGAIDCFMKPFDDDDFLAAVELGVQTGGGEATG
jgi:CheY-like chemotaxis protein